MIYLLIFLGAGLGGVSRFLVSQGLKTLLNSELPYPTLIVNVSGCLLMGFLVSVLFQKGIHSSYYLKETFLIGFLGGYTTFSTFSIEALEMMIHQSWWHMTAYVGGHFVLTIFACALGYLLGTKVGI